MANTKHAKKAARQAAKHQELNRIYGSGSRTAVKRAKQAISSGSDAQEAVKQAIVMLDRAASKKIIHKNNAARRKSRLIKQLNAAK
jgi:small subunit ribosomal protein S20